MKVSQEELDGARSRVAERFGVKSAPTVLSAIPGEIVRDAALNLSRSLDGDSALLARGDRLIIGYGVVVAKTGSPQKGLAQWLADAAKQAGKTDDELEAAQAVALACATYNGYYKFRSLVDQSKDFDGFGTALRASPFVRSALSKTLVELVSLAVSVMNGCGQCVNGHVQTIRQAGLSNPNAAIDEAVRISAVVAALAAWDHD
ncbi:MAG: carboxymuconolactone decarboxylase family protein [Polyangia bacterium]|jgi:alkyl hydroperoxide reductase subunit D